MKTPEKARARKAPEVVENVGFSMTPMIDIVFQVCGSPDIRIYKVEINAQKPAP